MTMTRGSGDQVPSTPPQSTKKLRRFDGTTRLHCGRSQPTIRCPQRGLGRQVYRRE
jgi:hypothetical protein